MQELIISRTTTGQHQISNNLTISASLQSNDRRTEEHLNKLADALFDNADNPAKGRGEVIKFTTSTGVTGTIEVSSPLNSKQEQILRDAGISYKKEAGRDPQSFNEKATNDLFKVLTSPPGEQAGPYDINDPERMKAMSAYSTARSLVGGRILPGGADPNAIDPKTGKLPLQLALEREGKLNFLGGVKDARSIIPILLEHGADPNKKNANGESPMDTVKRLDRKDVIELFKSKERHSSLEEPGSRDAALKTALAGLGTPVSLTDRDPTSVASPSVGRGSGSKHIV
jgi:hypothetical protein